MFSISKDWLRRGVRTFIDAFIVTMGIVFIPVVADLYNQIITDNGRGEIDIDLNVWGNLLLACMLAGGIAVFNMAKNAIEDKTGRDFIVKK